MEQLLALRPFVPARDLAVATRFYGAIGFRATHADDDVVMLKLESFGFILQRFDMPALAENLMIQMLVRDADTWWKRVDGPALVSAYGVKAPRPPAMQSWGMKVGFLFDPGGVLWHVAEAPF